MQLLNTSSTICSLSFVCAVHFSSRIRKDSFYIQAASRNSSKSLKPAPWIFKSGNCSAPWKLAKISRPGFCGRSETVFSLSLKTAKFYKLHRKPVYFHQPVAEEGFVLEEEEEGMQPRTVL
jgi:hypothetical protein